MTPEQITALREKYNIQPIVTSTTPTTLTTATGTIDRVAMAKELVAMRKKQPLKSTELKEGFVSKVGSDLERRAGQLRETYEQTATGEINPAETGIRTIGSLISGISDVAFRAAGGILKGLTPDVIEKPVVEAGTKALKKVVSNPIVSETITTLQRLAEENPRAAKDISALIDIATVLPVGAGAKATKPIVSAAEKAVSRTTQKGADILKYGITQATGLGRETVETIIKNPEAFSKKIAETLNRESLGAQVKNAINKRLAAQSTLGTEYNAIRKMTDKVVNLGGTLKESSLKKFGLQMKDGFIKMTAESKPFSTSELKTIENFIETYGRSHLSPNAVLNAREALSNIAKFESGKTGTLINWAKEVRANLNKVAQKQIPKLEKLDNAYSAETRILKQIKKDYFKQGSTDFKDNALGRLANLTKEGRQPILNRLKEFVPDIEKKVNILRAIEDIKSAGGIKVGTYVKGGLALGGAMSGNIPLLLGAIFAQPEVIVPILRAWGKFRLAQKGLVEVIIKKLETGVQLAKDEERFVSQAIGNWGSRVIKSTENIKPGMTIEDVTKLQKGKGEILKSTNPKNFKTAEDYVKAQPTAYHFTSPETKITKWSTKKSQGRIWFTDKTDVSDNIGASGRGKMYTVRFDKNAKWATPQQANKSYTDQLIADGYDGVFHPDNSGEYGNYYEVFNPSVIKTKSQLISEWNKAHKLKSSSQSTPKTPLKSSTDSLIQQAKKYKSAEEFIKAQGTPVYHGTNKSFSNFELTEGKRSGFLGSENTVKNQAIFVSDNKSVADFYGKNRAYVQGGQPRLIEAVIPNKNIIDISKSLPTEVKNKALSLIQKWEGGKIKTSIPVSRQNWLLDQPEFVKLLKDKGYIGAKLNEGSVLKSDKYTLKTKGGNYTYAIFDPINVKTKEQLIEIWNKANRLK